MIGTVLAGLILGYTTFVPALAKLPISSILVMTAGLLTLIQGVLLIGWSSQPYALPPISGEAPVQIPRHSRADSGVLDHRRGRRSCIVGLWYLLARTRLGLALRACAENRLAARLMGIDVPRMTLLSFALAALIAGLAGIAIAPITSLEFDTGGFFTNFGFISVAIGGLGAFAGSVFGGLVLGVSEQLAAGYVSSLFANGLALALLLVDAAVAAERIVQRRPGSAPGRARRAARLSRDHPPRGQGRSAVRRRSPSPSSWRCRSCCRPAASSIRW